MTDDNKTKFSAGESDFEMYRDIKKGSISDVKSGNRSEMDNRSRVGGSVYQQYTDKDGTIPTPVIGELSSSSEESDT